MIRFVRFFLFSFLVLLIVSIASTSAYSQCDFSNGPEGEICDNAVYICGSALNGYTGKLRVKNSTNVIWPGNPNPNQGVCQLAGQFDNTSWFSFTACSKVVHLRITFSNCVQPANNLAATGIQTGLYTGCNKNSSVACQDSFGNKFGSIDLMYNQFVPGQLVYFVIDGYASSVCEFTIQIISGIDVTPVIPPDPTTLKDGYITGNNIIKCEEKNVPFTYSLIEPEREVSFNAACTPPNTFNPADSICYVWNVLPISGRNFTNQDSIGKNINLVFTEPGVYTIYADTYFNPFYVGSCANAAAGSIVSWTVTVLPKENVSEPLEYICPGDTRFYCGQLISSDSVVVCDADPCRIVTKEFKVGTSKLNLLGTQYICQGSSFQFQGLNYNTAGTYDVVDNVDCSLVHRFVIDVVTVSAQILPGNTLLDCNRPTILLQGNGIISGNSVLEYSWKDQSGIELSKGKDLTINKSGDYIFSVSFSSTNGICQDEKRITITENFKKPKITATLPTVRCYNPKEQNPVITVTSQDPLAVTTWTTPLGVVSNSLNVSVDSLNVIKGSPYLFSAIGVNGCRLDTSFLIKSNFEKATIRMMGDDLSCFQPKQTLTVSTNIPIDSIRWHKIAPDNQFFGSHLSKLTHDVSDPGTYKVEVMASASKCWNNESIAIADNRIYPDLALNTDVKWHCNTQSIEIIPLTSTGANIGYSWASQNGKILSSENERSLLAGSPGEYFLIVSDTSNGCNRSGSIQVVNDLNLPSSIDYQTDDILCYGEKNGTLEINTTTGGYGPYQYFLNGVLLTQDQISSLSPGQYELTVKDFYNCAYTSTFNIIEPSLLLVETEPELSIEYNEVATLTFQSNYDDSEIKSVAWTNSKGDILGTDRELSFSSILSDEIFVEVTNLNGCSNRAKIKINVDTNLKIYFPNIFSPNGDGVNDRLTIVKNKLPVNIDRISIFDRYGNKVFEQKNFNFENEVESWDGTFNGSDVIAGVYIMLVELTELNGQKQILKKDLTLVR